MCYLSSIDRLSNFIVTVSNISFPATAAQLVPPAFTRCGQYQGYPEPGQAGTVTCSPGPSRGRYVFISLPTLGILTMCETRVFAGMLNAKFKVCQHGFFAHMPAQCEHLWDLLYWAITIHPECRNVLNIGNYCEYLQEHCQCNTHITNKSHTYM